MQKGNIHAPFRSPSSNSSKATLVRNLKQDVRTPEATKPARNDCRKLKWHDIVNNTIILKEKKMKQKELQ
jgi:hypothetical protein